VMMMATTPSVNASTLPLPMIPAYKRICRKTVNC
jgi:hypothetical protein